MTGLRSRPAWGKLYHVYRDPAASGFICTWLEQDEFICRLNRSALTLTGMQPKLPHYAWLSSISGVSWGSAIIGVDDQKKVPAWCTWDETSPKLFRVTDFSGFYRVRTKHVKYQ